MEVLICAKCDLKFYAKYKFEEHQKKCDVDDQLPVQSDYLLKDIKIENEEEYITDEVCIIKEIDCGVVKNECYDSKPSIEFVDIKEPLTIDIQKSFESENIDIKEESIKVEDIRGKDIVKVHIHIPPTREKTQVKDFKDNANNKIVIEYGCVDEEVSKTRVMIPFSQMKSLSRFDSLFPGVNKDKESANDSSENGSCNKSDGLIKEENDQSSDNGEVKSKVLVEERKPQVGDFICYIRDALKCVECDFETYSIVMLKKHLLAHEERKLYCCSHCSYTALRAGSLRKHVRMEHTVRFNQVPKHVSKCQKCGFKASGERFRKHILTSHREKKRFCCLKCTYSSNYPGILKFHSENHCSKSKKRYACNGCSFASRGMVALMSHIEERHLHPRRFCCAFCAFQTDNAKGIQKHGQLIHINEESAKTASCDICGFRSFYMGELHAHMKSEHDNLYVCRVCGHKTETVKETHQHRSTHKTHYCKFKSCGYYTQLEHLLHAHVKKHHKPLDQKESCELCSFQSEFAPLLRVHMEVKHKTARKS